MKSIHIKSIGSVGLTVIFALYGMAASHANDMHHAISHTDNGKAPATSSSSADMSEGEIRKVDKENGKLTIRHGELKNLGMPGMTMVFQAKDKAMLDRVKAGDKVNFVADNIGGKLTVMQLEPTMDK